MKHLMAAVLFGIAMAGAAIAQPAEKAQYGAPAVMTRAEAVSRALGDDPGLAAANESVRAAEASAGGAGLRPNPTLELQLEDFAGSGPFDGVDGAQATYSLSQKFELGGDRRARRQFAEREAHAARIGAGLSELDLRETVEVAFVEAQAAEALVGVARARLDVARKFADAVERRVRSARDPQAAQARVAARLAETETELATAEARAKAAKAALASYWGGDLAFAVETATFYSPQLRTDIGAPPDIALAEAERASAEARVDIERAKRVPDPEINAGFRRLYATDSSAFVVGVKVPLPVWNRNSAAIASARADASRAEYQVAARARVLSREVGFLSSQMEASRAEVEAYTARVIPSGEQALSRALEAYRQGGLSYIDVLDAQSSLNDARARLISALLTYHRAEAQLARRTGALSPDLSQEISK